MNNKDSHEAGDYIYLETLAINYGDVLAVYDYIGDTVLFVSSNIRTLLGAPSQSKGIREAFLECTKKEDLGVIKKIFKRFRNTSIEQEIRVTNKITGETKWILFQALSMENSQPGTYLIILHDQSIQKEQNNLINKAIYASQSPIRKNNNLINQISHDIRIPLNTIAGMANILDIQLGGKDENIKHYLDKIEKCTNEINIYIDDVVLLYKLEFGNLAITQKLYSYKDTVDSVLAKLKEVMEDREVSVNHINDLKEDYLIGDEEKVKKVIYNILTCFILMSSKNHVIYIETSKYTCKDKRDVMQICIYNKNEIYDELTIASLLNVVSICNKEIYKIGSALYLPVAKLLLERMGGTFSIRNTKRKGSVINIKIPYKKESAYQMKTRLDDNKCLSIGATDRQFKTKLNLEKLRILIVEDNPLNREMFYEVLITFGCMVDTANDGEEAINKFQTSDIWHYNLIFMDVEMPKVDGYTATTEIRKIEREDNIIPIVAMTANIFPEDRIRSFLCGMSEHITKPINRKEIERILEKYCHSYTV